MTAPARRRPNLGSVLLIVVVVIVALLLLAPSAVAAQVGGFIGWLWVSVMSAVMSIIGGLFGAA